MNVNWLVPYLSGAEKTYEYGYVTMESTLKAYWNAFLHIDFYKNRFSGYLYKTGKCKCKARFADA